MNPAGACTVFCFFYTRKDFGTLNSTFNVSSACTSRTIFQAIPTGINIRSVSDHISMASRKGAQWYDDDDLDDEFDDEEFEDDEYDDEEGRMPVKPSAVSRAFSFSQEKIHR